LDEIPADLLQHERVTAEPKRAELIDLFTGVPKGRVSRAPSVSRCAGGRASGPAQSKTLQHLAKRRDEKTSRSRRAIIGLGGAVMQIRLSPDLDECARAVRTPMTVDEFLARFPEVPPDLRDEPVLGEYVRAFGLLLRVAQKPTPCMRDTGDHQHFFYTRLVNDLAIYGIGLAKRDRTLVRLRALLDQYQQQPATFACTLVPRKARGTPRTGCT
jgi:hypothetical protein